LFADSETHSSAEDQGSLFYLRMYQKCWQNVPYFCCHNVFVFTEYRSWNSARRTSFGKTAALKPQVLETNMRYNFS